MNRCQCSLEVLKLLELNYPKFPAYFVEGAREKLIYLRHATSIYDKKDFAVPDVEGMLELPHGVVDIPADLDLEGIGRHRLLNTLPHDIEAFSVDAVLIIAHETAHPADFEEEGLGLVVAGGMRICWRRWRYRLCHHPSGVNPGEQGRRGLGAHARNGPDYYA